ncbi:MAG: DUF4342 domain-containing protein [Chloroflexota bacterium]
MSEHQDETPRQEKQTVVEEMEISGQQVVKQIRELVRQGNIRRIIVKSKEGRKLLDVPLTLGAGAAGVGLMVGGLPLAILTAGAAAVARVRLEVVREVNDGDVVYDNSRVSIDVDDEATDEGNPQA